MARRIQIKEVGLDELNPQLQQPSQLNQQIEENTDSSFFDLIGAHIKDNSLRFTAKKYINTLDSFFLDEEQDPNFRVTENDVIGYEDFPQLMQARTSNELAQYKAIADDIKLQRKIKAEHGILANLAASFFDPINVASSVIGGGIANAGFKVFKLGKTLTGVSGTVIKSAASGVSSGAVDVGLRSIGDEQNPEKYVIGASVGGVMGAFFGAAPSIFRALKPEAKAKLKQSAQIITQDFQTPTIVEDEASSIADAKIQSAFGFEKFTRVSPDLQLANSTFETAREFGAKMLPDSFSRVDAQGNVVAQGATVEMLIQADKAMLKKQAHEKLQACFKAYLDESGNYNWCGKTFKNWKDFSLWQGKAYKEFSNEVFEQLLSEENTTNVSKAITDAVNFFKENSQKLSDKALKAGVYNARIEEARISLKKEQTELLNTKKRTNSEEERLKVIGEQLSRLSSNDVKMGDFAKIKDPVYFPRIYNTKYVEEHRTEFIDAIVKAYRAEGTLKNDNELREMANKSINKFVHLKTGMEWEVTRASRRFELERVLDIKSKFIAEFLEHDPMKMYDGLVDTLVPDIHIAKTFHTINKDKILETLTAEYTEKSLLLHGKNKELQALNKEYKDIQETISVIWDRVREDPNSRIDECSNFIQWVMNFNVARSLGSLPLATLYDAFSISQHIGMGSFLKRTYHLIKAKELFGNKENADLFIRAIDATEKNRITDLSEVITEGMTRNTARALTWASGARFIDEKTKTIVGYTALEKIINACQKSASGKTLNKNIRGQLRQWGIKASDESLIASEFAKYGNITKNGIMQANVEKWQEGTRNVLVSAIKKVQNMAVLSPTKGVTPKFFDNQYLAAILQFKRCMFAAYSKVLVPYMQDLRAGRFGKTASVFSVGYSAAYIKELAKDFVDGKKSEPEKIAERAASSLDLWSFGGFCYDVLQKLKAASDKPFVGVTDASLYLFGPTGGLIKDAIGATTGVYSKMQGKQMTKSQIHAVRRMLPFNNLIWWARGINYLEESLYPVKTKKYYLQRYGN